MVGKRSTTSLLGAAVALFVLAGCATTVTGTGSGAVSGTSSAPTPSPSDTGLPSHTAVPTDTPSATPSPTPSSAPAPTPVPPPSSCPAATCKKVASASLGDGYQVVLRGDLSAGGGFGVGVLELTYLGVPVFWTVKDGETPAQLACSDQPAKRCIVVAYVGAHAANARLWKVVGSTLVAGGLAEADTPTMQAADLNADGYVDVRGLQNNYTPDYATGKVYWQTWLSNGSSLTSTGCGPLSSTLPPPPAAVQTGPCG